MISIVPVSFSVILNAPSAKKLLGEYAEECSIPEIGPINPQADMYDLLEQKGVMQCYGAFQDVQLVGFASVLTTVFPHYGKKVATVESLFVAAEHRATSAGKDLMRALDEHCKVRGCTGVLYSAPAGGKLEMLLDNGAKFRRTNVVFYRSLA